MRYLDRPANAAFISGVALMVVAVIEAFMGRYDAATFHMLFAGIMIWLADA
jgi:hypothetical protein